MRRAAIIAILFWIACSPRAHEAKPVSERGEKLYTLKGTIVSRDTSENTLRIDHEAVPGVMEAMTMDYSVRGATVAVHPVQGRGRDKPGDRHRCPEHKRRLPAALI